MGEHSKIEWTNHTFNPWWGCTKVSEACKHCYAEAWAKRVGQKVWGPKSDRRFFGETHWSQPVKWNRKAASLNERHRVFCASMADVFEDREELVPWRAKLADLIAETPHLDWLLLTKRPDKCLRLSPWVHDWPENVWLGTTVELQSRADELLPHLDRVPASVRFISAEPLLGPLDLSDWLGETLGWVIAGGESGPKARPANPDWFRSIRQQCIANGVPFHFKQWGDWAPDSADPAQVVAASRYFVLPEGVEMVRLGKKKAGRVLDGETWNQLPVTQATSLTA